MVTTLRIPIARLGRWYHPVYRNNKGEPVVEFTQEDFDSIVNAFLTDDRGYEPYLTYGHVKATYDRNTIDGFPIEGHLVNLEQVEEVLYGDFIPNNDKVVEEIKTGRYRYASGEFVRGLPSKKIDAKVRVFLKGVALTNTPFVPNLPRNAVQDLTEVVLLSESIELGDNTVQLSQGAVSSCQECSTPECTGCLPETVTNTPEQATVETSLENTQPNMVEKTEDVKEIKSILSDLKSGVDWMKSFFTAKKQEEEAAIQEELTETDTPKAAEEESPVSESIEETPMEDKTPNAELEAALAELAALKDAKAQLEADNVALAEAAAAFELEKLAVEKAAKDQALSDKINSLVTEGLAPAVADRVKDLVSSSNDSVIALSDGNQVNLGDAVLDLVRELIKPDNRVDLEQVGASGDTTNLSEDADNPWASVIMKYRDKQSQ